MRITVIDAFGTKRGVAEVQWEDVNFSLTGEDGPKSHDEEASMVGLAQTVLLPTHNRYMDWRLKVEV
jgi:hypothetical protein